MPITAIRESLRWLAPCSPIQSCNQGCRKIFIVFVGYMVYIHEYRVDEVAKTANYKKNTWKIGCGVFQREMSMKKPKVKKVNTVKPVRSRLREDLKNPAFRAQYEEKQRTLKLAVKLATQREKKGS